MKILVLCFLVFISGITFSEPVTRVLQNGLGGYSGAVDTYLPEDEAFLPIGDRSPFLRLTSACCAEGAHNILIRFDLTPEISAIPSSAEILEATLSFFCFNDINPEDYTRTFIFRIGEEWSAKEATWFNRKRGEGWRWYGAIDLVRGPFGYEEMPADATNRWIHYDVTETVREFIADPESNHGFSISFYPEEPDNHQYRACSYEADKTLRPKLKIKFVDNNSSIINRAENSRMAPGFQIEIQSNALFITTPLTDEYELSFIDLMGRKVFSKMLRGKVSQLDLSSVPAGVYLISVLDGNRMHILRRITLAR